MNRLIALLLIIFQIGAAMMANAEVKNQELWSEGVSRELARHRAANISELRYQLSFNLVPGAARIKGHEEIGLKLKDATDPVFLDFRDLDEHGRVVEGAISNPSVNGSPVNDLRQAGGHIIFPSSHFKSGGNTISMDFETGVATANRPIIRYQDRDDGSEYIYTLFVPMDASLAFPCFDQPDLKARFTLAAAVPTSWAVVTNTREQTVTRSGANSFWVFRETHPISAYLFAFAAGPLKEIASEGGAVPLRLFVRQSKLQRAKEEWPEVERLTIEGMKRMTEFFDQPFPFNKYDQALIPGFAYGGMEHAGATFLREDSVLFRTTPTKSDKMNRASLILHELTHQWFGDLVTMRWFDDLWLKEGFANFMAYHTMAEIYNPNEVWKRFYQTIKPPAYAIDSTKGTTPIYQEVRNLKDAKSAYGAIVYQKAPSILRALTFLIGEENFRDGVRLFLKEHAYANAEWSDLIGAFERVSKQKLQLWADAWVKRRGAPRVDVEWSCDARGLIDRFEIRQRDVLAEGGLWPIKTRLSLAYDGGEAQSITTSFDSERSTVSDAVGKKCPAYVFANDGDFGYGIFMLDPKSRAAVMSRIGGIGDPFPRALLWGALWDSVREAEMNPRDYIALVLKALPNEADLELAKNLLGRATYAFEQYLSTKDQNAIAPQLESLLFDRMMNAGAVDLRITYFRAFRSAATTLEARGRLKDLLSGRTRAPGVEIKPLDRWYIVTTLLARKDADAENLLEAERKRDTSDDGRKQAYIAEAARADSATKQRYFNDYLNNRAMPEDWVEASLSAFNWPNQSSLTLPYLKPALEALPQVKRERKIFFTLAWLNAFIGGQRTREAFDQVQEFLRGARLDRDLELKVLEVMDELERTVKIRANY
ncbi:MAG: ERAP1-like C-terminal domain-containing protein [Chloracidobacterium sp.]|nr:ERAP1-like C-terminal domain-containing protein [Chloracidobacterium sp.]